MTQYEPINIPDDAPYINALLYQTMQGIEEVLGSNGLKAVLQNSGLERYVNNPPPNDLASGIAAREFAQLNAAIEVFTGRAGKGMLQRIGRAAFRWGIKEQSAAMGLAGLALKALPQRLRMRAVLLGIRKGLMDTVPYGLIDVRDEDGTFVFTDYACVICHMRQDDRPLCHMYIGTLSEAMAYATGKDFRQFEVIETHCRGKGDGYCRFEIREKE